MEKVSKQQICCYILVLVLFSFCFLLSISESSPSLLTTLLALLSTMFLVTLTRKKGDVTKESETTQRHELQAEALDGESCNCSIIDTSLEGNAQKHEQHADPTSDSSSLASDHSEASGSIKSESFENGHNRTQNLGLSNTLVFANDVDCVDDDDDDEDSLIEIKLPNSNFFGLNEKLESNLLRDSIFKQRDLMELLEEINEMNEDENLIEIDISMGCTKCQGLSVKQDLSCYYGDQCGLSD